MVLRTKPLGLGWQSDGNGALNGSRGKRGQQTTIPRCNTGHALLGGLIIEIDGSRAASDESKRDPEHPGEHVRTRMGEGAEGIVHGTERDYGAEQGRQTADVRCPAFSQALEIPSYGFCLFLRFASRDMRGDNLARPRARDQFGRAAVVSPDYARTSCRWKAT